MISPQHPYNPYDQPGIPLELSPRISRIPHHQLFPSMESEGEVSATHTPHVDDEQGDELPPEGFPFTGIVPSLTLPETSGPMFPISYTTLASYLYQNPIWSSNSMPTSGPFIPNVTSRTSVQTVVMSVPIQPMIPSQPISSFQPTLPVQLTISDQVSVSSSTPPSSGQDCATSWGEKSEYYPCVR